MEMKVNRLGLEDFRNERSKCETISNGEVRKALRNTDGEKTSGLNGIAAEFLRKEGEALMKGDREILMNV